MATVGCKPVAVEHGPTEVVATAIDVVVVATTSKRGGGGCCGTAARNTIDIFDVGVTD